MSKQCQDHLGNIFASFSAMCKFYCQPRTRAQYRLDNGQSLEHALLDKGYECTDYAGNIFKSFNAMCHHYNKLPECVRMRLQKGMPLKDALEKEVESKSERTAKSRSIPCTDHKGNWYRSLSVMARTYGVNKRTFLDRIAAGWSIEDALEGNPVLSAKCNNIPVKDFKGILYPSYEALCREYKISRQTVSYRLLHGATFEEALTLPRNMYIGEYRVAECLKRLNVKFYHDCSIKAIFDELNISVNWNEFLSELQSKLGKAGFNWSKKKIQRLRPDFVLYTDDDNKIRGIIEFDGEQHQNFVEYFFKTIEEFLRRSNTDFIKASLWEYMNIPMLRIRYDQIDMIDDMVKDFLDNPERYITNHNTYMTEQEYWAPLKEERERIEMAFAA